MREALARSDGDFTLSDKIEETPSRYIGVMRVLLQRPVEVAGLVLMTGFGLAIMVNALALQTGMHASPFLRAQQQAAAGVAAPAGAPGADANVPADQAAPDAVAVLRDVQLALAERGLYDGLADGVNGPKTTASIRSFQQHNGLPVDGLSTPTLLAKINASSAPVLTPDSAAADAPPPAQSVDQIAAIINSGTPAPAAGPQPDKRLLAVEKALSNQGYGPLKVDGFMSKETHSAIGKFEKDNSLPITGQVSQRLIQALTRSGSKIE